MFRLQFVFHSSLEGALELVDEKAVTVLSSPSGRKIFQVWAPKFLVGCYTMR